MARRAKTDQILELMLLAFGPRNDMGEFDRRLPASRNGTTMTALDEYGPFQILRNFGSLGHSDLPTSISSRSRKTMPRRGVSRV